MTMIIKAGKTQNMQHKMHKILTFKLGRPLCETLFSDHLTVNTI